VRFQVTRHKLAEMATKVTAARALTYRVADRIRAGDPVLTEIAMAKNLAAQVANEVCWEAVQILAAWATCARRWSSASPGTLASSHWRGTTEIMNEIIAKTLGI